MKWGNHIYAKEDTERKSQVLGEKGLSGHLHIYLGRGYGLSDNFGWGKVNRIFPQRYNYNLKTDEDNNNYIVCDKDISASGIYRKYTRVYRYKGGGK